MQFKLLAIVLCAATALGGCAVGPDFRRPEAPKVSTYTEIALPAETVAAGVGSPAQRFEAGEDIPAQWWSLFHSPALDRLIRQALEMSPTRAAAQATLRQAEENMRAQTGALLLAGAAALGGRLFAATRRA